MPAYDAFLLVSFGGPEGPDEVMPFLENVTRGRGIPPERLASVAEHYYAVGGVSPINQQCRDLLAAVRADFSASGLSLPVYWGNRNWTPYLTDTVRAMADDGVRRAVALVTSAYSSYSSCRQYLDDIERARAAVGPDAPRIDKIRRFFNHPGFIEPFAESTRAALATLPADLRDDAHLVFTAHSVPVAMAEASGPGGGHRYVAELTEAARLIAERAGGGTHPHTLAYQSRSGPPSQPWLEPDVCDHLGDLAKSGTQAVVVIPVGFVSDHMEVRHDLDVEAAQSADSLGLAFARAATPGSHPRFASMVTELVRERLALPDEAGHRPRSGTWACRPGLSGGLLPVRRARRPAQGGRRGIVGMTGTQADEDAEALLRIAVAAAGEAGRLLASWRGDERPEVVETKSSPTDVVTEMDRRSEALITSRIRAHRPGDAVLGEEGGQTAGGPAGGESDGGRPGRVRWVVDPLDGTVNYLYGLFDWAVSIAAEVDGTVVAGVVEVPRHGETFTAVAGQGAWLHRGEARVALHCTSGVPLGQALVGTGFGYDSGRRRVQGEVIAALLPYVRDIRRGGSAAVDLCSVAAGRLDAFFERGLNYWDFAAGGLIAREAGAAVGGLAGKTESTSMAVAAGPGLYQQLDTFLTKLNPERDAQRSQERDG